MSVRRPQWVQHLAFLIFELTDPAGAAQVRMSRAALKEAGYGPSGRRAGLDDPASLSALSGEDTRHETNRPQLQAALRLVSGPAPNPGPSSPLSASDHAACLTAGPPPRGQVASLPGMAVGRAQLLLFALIVIGTPLGWAVGRLLGAVA